MSNNLSKIKVDAKDQQILALLQQNGRISMSELAQQVNLSDTPCMRRVNKLQQAGYISGYHARINAAKLGYDVVVYALIKLQQNSAKTADAFEQHIDACLNVQECSVITGEYDYLLKIIAKDLGSYEQFVKHQLGSIAGIAAIDSTVVLKERFSRWQLPL